jgi:hypothetical protein
VKRRAFVQVTAFAAAGLHPSIEPIARAGAQGAEPLAPRAELLHPGVARCLREAGFLR